MNDDVERGDRREADVDTVDVDPKETRADQRRAEFRTVDDEDDDSGAEAGGGAGRRSRDPDVGPEEHDQALEERIEELQDQLLRKQAELVNYRKRVERERTELSARARADLLKELLPIFDDFERAVGAEADDVESYREGVELILRSIEALMRRLEVERVSPDGEAFDPEFHEAMARLESDEVPPGHVLEVYQPGYVMGGRLVRPARVVVAVEPDEGDDGSDGSDGGRPRDRDDG